MRRAVAACTSPEVFFGRSMMGEHTAAPPSSVVNDPLGMAMENLTLNTNIPSTSTAINAAASFVPSHSPAGSIQYNYYFPGGLSPI